MVGGVAFAAHGSAHVTWDIDICYSRATLNLERISNALLPIRPTLRGPLADLPFTLDVPTIQSGLNFALATEAGHLALVGEITGLGTYEAVAHFAERLTIYDFDVNVLSLEGLERTKRASGRPRDLVHLAEILEIRRQTGTYSA